MSSESNAASASVSGATEPPSPVTSVVMPCVTLLRARLSIRTLVSDWPRDRKSTRLNSSHVRISYAVFCLKKKKKLTTESPPHTTERQKLHDAVRRFTAG